MHSDEQRSVRGAFDSKASGIWQRGGKKRGMSTTKTILLIVALLLLLWYVIN